MPFTSLNNLNFQFSLVSQILCGYLTSIIPQPQQSQDVSRSEETDKNGISKSIVIPVSNASKFLFFLILL